MKVLLDFLLLAYLTCSTILASPLPVDCHCSKESKSSKSPVFRWPRRNDRDPSQARLGDNYYAKTLNDFISISQTTTGDLDEFNPWPTPIDPTDRPMSTTELMQQKPVQPLSTLRSLPSAPTDVPERVATTQPQILCGTSSIQEENRTLTWIVALVILGLIALFLIAMSIVEVVDNLWARWQGISLCGRGQVQLDGREQKLGLRKGRRRKLSTIDEKDEMDSDAL